MRILFVSDPYVERAMLEYFFHAKDHTFIMLKANHPEIQDGIKNNIKFLHFNDAVETCNCVFVLKTEYVGEDLIAKCKIAAKEKDILFYCTEITKKSEDLRKYLGGILNTNVASIPSVLILQAGTNAQIEKTEINICHWLRSNKVKYKLFTNTWLLQISDLNSVLNINVAYDNATDAQISIISIKENVLDLLSNSTKTVFFDVFLRTIQPDYIILCCENDYGFQNELKKTFEIKYSRSIDLFIRSEYVTLCSNNEGESPLLVESIENEYIFEDLKMKLTFPHGVYEISPKP